MGFIKGALMGAVIGTTVAFMNQDMMNKMVHKGTKEINKLKSKCCM